ncbi:hypothetical protein [Pararhodobacter sp.]|uniref:hypothetical protein n=1 Tax=Pararhodobacter sp. TaxID=2127056 RepID=UPI002AFE4252|nr:hypothetical protein [Pararhodobacter sp.]
MWTSILRKTALIAAASGLALAALLAQSVASNTPNAPTLSAPTQGLRVFHLGHSLVGRDMPAMLAQLAQAAGLPDHRYESQLGWGTSLRAHWDERIEIGGFEAENDHAHFRPAHEAIDSGDYDVIVLTEMVELRDAIRWHDSPRYLPLWVEAARAARPDVRVYLYKTWHDLEHPDGWLARLENDPAELWERQLLASVWANPALGPLHIIPSTQVLAELTRRMQNGETAPGLTRPEDLFRINPDGTLDTIHLNDQGNYLIALVHFATLYHRSVVGLPFALHRADGTQADPIDPFAAAMMQRIVDAVVRATPNTGLAPEALE